MSTIEFPGGNTELPDLRKYYKQFKIFFIIAIVFYTVMTCYYEIEPNEKGVIQRFGKFVRISNPGPHFRIPFGIETLKKVKVTVPFREEFGYATKATNIGGATEYYSQASEYDKSINMERLVSNQIFNNKVGFPQRSFLAESLMLTGDLNFADVTWIIQYKISDPYKFLFNVRNVEETIRNMSEAIVREVVGDFSIDEILTFGKAQIQEQSKKMLQKVLDEYECGILITQLAFQDVNPPAEVKSAFEEVNKAEQEKKKTIDQAWADYNRFIPRAKGEAEKLVSEAHGYAINRTNIAKGESERFNQTYEEYKKAVDVTRRRMYLETMADVLPQLKEILIVDEKLNGVLPFLPLNESQKGAK